MERTERREYGIDYEPRRPFIRYHDRSERFAVLVAHRRAGKTVATIQDKIKRAVISPLPHGRYAYVAPFLAQAKEVAWEYLKRFAEPVIVDLSEAELWIEVIGGARIRIHGADNPDRLRGTYLDGVVLDEYADMRPSVWGEVIRPMLADRQGWATFIGTPMGHNAFYEVMSGSKVSPSGRLGAVHHPDWYPATVRAVQTGLLAKR